VWGAMLALFVPAAAWADAGGRIAYNVDDQIFTMRGDGSERTPLGKGYQPDWSPDGTRIAFTRANRGTELYRIWSMAADGTGAQPLTPRRRGSVDADPDWSPDGRQLAYVRYRYESEVSTSRLVIRDLASGSERVVAGQGRTETVSDPAWSPDGSRILYGRLSSRGERVDLALYVLDVATGTSRRLVSDGRDGAWSPDGSRIAYASFPALATCTENCLDFGDIHVVGADGTGDVAVTATPEVDDSTPAWAPDGGAIVFGSNRNSPSSSQYELYAVRPDGGCLTWLTNGAGSSQLADWKPGSGGVPDALGCGAVPRAPSDLLAPRGPGWWVGPVGPGGLLASDSSDSSEPGESWSSLSYTDCSAFDPAQCGPSFDLESTSTCNRNPLDYKPSRSVEFRIMRGTLVLEVPGDDAAADVYAGDSAVTFYPAEAAAVPPLVDALRPRDWVRPVGDLPPPRFPRSLLRRIDEARRAGSARALRKRGASRFDARYMIRLAQALEPLQPLRAARC
jgi:dipeptidyl aminopeptidase/acylaminoacyl peptidase